MKRQEERMVKGKENGSSNWEDAMAEMWGKTMKMLDKAKEEIKYSVFTGKLSDVRRVNTDILRTLGTKEGRTKQRF